MTTHRLAAILAADVAALVFTSTVRLAAPTADD